MNWFDQWFYRKVKYCWENKHEFEKSKGSSMKWLGRWLFKIIQKSQQEDDSRMGAELAVPSAKLSRSSDVDGEEDLNITIRKAVGGRIVSFRNYDRKSDRHFWKTYVIHDELDFERELGKIITLESLR